MRNDEVKHKSNCEIGGSPLPTITRRHFRHRFDSRAIVALGLIIQSRPISVGLSSTTFAQAYGTAGRSSIRIGTADAKGEDTSYSATCARVSTKSWSDAQWSVEQRFSAPYHLTVQDGYWRL